MVPEAGTRRSSLMWNSNSTSPGIKGQDGEACSSQSQILAVNGDWSGRYNTGGEPTLLEGLRKCVSKELGVIPTSPFKKSSSSSSTASYQENRDYQQDHKWFEKLPRIPSLRDVLLLKRYRKHNSKASPGPGQSGSVDWASEFCSIRSRACISVAGSSQAWGLVRAQINVFLPHQYFCFPLSSTL